MATAAGVKTIVDLHAMPDDGRRYELINGEIVVAAAPGEPHMIVQTELQLILLPSERVHGRGKLFIAPYEVHLPTGDIVQPDLFFVTVGRYEIRRGIHVEGAPDLVVEVVSPSSRSRDLGEKRLIYETAGVLEYWVADPQDRSFTALTLRRGRYVSVPPVGSVLRSLVLPEVAIDIEAIFAELPWFRPNSATAGCLADITAVYFFCRNGDVWFRQGREVRALHAEVPEASLKRATK